MYRKRIASMSPEQKRDLINYMYSHPQLRSGKFSSDFTLKQAESQWREMSELLNGLPGPKKAWRQWRKTWQDLKTKSKKDPNLITKLVRRSAIYQPTVPMDNITDRVECKKEPICETAYVEQESPVFEEVECDVGRVEHEYSATASNDQPLSKSEYYKRKLELYSQQVRVQSDIAQSLKSIAESLGRLQSNNYNVELSECDLDGKQNIVFETSY